MRFRSLPWKRSFTKLPPAIRAALQTIGTPLIGVAGTKAVPLSDITTGIYKHLGISADADLVSVSDGPILPIARMGKWSMRNRQGWERVRRDLPKITKTYTWETPNFGDASTYGTHMSSRDREVYQVEFDEPRAHKIKSEILRSSSFSEGARATVLIKFEILTLIDTQGVGFEKELLWALNVLQENTGVAGIFASDATCQEYLGTVALDWEVFPPGTAEEIIALFRKRRKGRGTKADTLMEDRLKLFASLKPSSYLVGTAQFASYIGAQFADDLVVFENAYYGNALYVLYENWRDVSKRSRIDLLKGTSERFDRFAHTDGWEERFLAHMRTELESRAPRRKR